MPLVKVVVLDLSLASLVLDGLILAVIASRADCLHCYTAGAQAQRVNVRALGRSVQA